MITQLTTYEQIIDSFKNFTDIHAMINDFGVGPVSDISTTRQMLFPYMWAVSTPSNIEYVNGTIIPHFSFSILFLDKINIQTGLDENGLRSDNQINIISDTQQLMIDFLIYVKNEMMLNYNEELSLSSEVVMDETTDKVCGWKLDIDIKVVNVRCEFPLK